MTVPPKGWEFLVGSRDFAGLVPLYFLLHLEEIFPLKSSFSTSYNGGVLGWREGQNLINRAVDSIIFLHQISVLCSKAYLASVQTMEGHGYRKAPSILEENKGY